MNRQSSMSIEERVYRFQEAQQILADTIGLAVPVPHGEPMKLYDIWEKRLVEVTLLRGTEVKKEPGKETQIFHFDKRDSDRVKRKFAEHANITEVCLRMGSGYVRIPRAI